MAILIEINYLGLKPTLVPLGHGLPIAVRAALAAKMKGEPWRVFVLTGDGELQEGSNWEAAMTAHHYSLDNLIVIVDHSRIQQGDFTESTIRMDPLPEKMAGFRFYCPKNLMAIIMRNCYRLSRSVPYLKENQPVYCQHPLKAKELASQKIGQHGIMEFQRANSFTSLPKNLKLSFHGKYEHDGENEILQ